ncbi:MAG: PAS domain-containing sensor histidine kinase [Chloroflexota bacterium]|nr:MAG: PAS domain-containing sensor histidine kinase [Chloroflexota bacterium]
MNDQAAQVKSETSADQQKIADLERRLDEALQQLASAQSQHQEQNGASGAAKTSRTSHGNSGIPMRIWDKVQNINERRRLRKENEQHKIALAEALDLNQKIISASQLGILAYRASGECVLANEAASRIMGAKAWQLLAQNLHKIESWVGSGLLDMAQETLFTGKPNHREVHYVTTFGREIWIECSFTLFTSRGEKHILLIFNDITDRKRPEAALKKREKEYRNLAENSPEVIARFDRQLRHTYINDYGAKVYGVPKDEVTGKTTAELGMPADKVAFWNKHFEEVLSSGVQQTVDFEFDSPTLGHQYFSSMFVPEFDENGEVVSILAITRDVTEIRRAEKVLAEYAHKLERSNHDLQEFAFVASHDLQEPLRKVKAFGNMLKQRLNGKLSDDETEQLDRMIKASVRMQDMIQDLLELSRVNTQGQAFRPVDLHDVAEDVVSDLGERISRVEGQVEIGDLPVIDGDPIQLQRLLLNLVGNGLKYHRDGVAPVIKVYARLGGEAGSDRGKESSLSNSEASATNTICLVVEDNGIGFDMKHLERIFQPFQRLHGRSRYDGTGMGLAICKKIVERHGGNITARSEPGKGSAFIVTLPLLENHKA